uniref:Uncharacterized protein n=1 Tax=Corethron hystrix TaxID=216773 RepID=A0A6U5HIM0_9STRA|mmetsp:Transcript_30612/g.70066  ORF Transcript_30612/g.70066 Transcript_30612/m.70066 type:complete len:483 (+) Transcript_30612:136-1584(+)
MWNSFSSGALKGALDSARQLVDNLETELDGSVGAAGTPASAKPILGASYLRGLTKSAGVSDPIDEEEEEDGFFDEEDTLDGLLQEEEDVSIKEDEEIDNKDFFDGDFGDEAKERAGTINDKNVVEPKVSESSDINANGHDHDSGGDHVPNDNTSETEDHAPEPKPEKLLKEEVEEKEHDEEVIGVVPADSGDDNEETDSSPQQLVTEAQDKEAATPEDISDQLEMSSSKADIVECYTECPMQKQVDDDVLPDGASIPADASGSAESLAGSAILVPSPSVVFPSAVPGNGSDELIAELRQNLSESEAALLCIRQSLEEERSNSVQQVSSVKEEAKRRLARAKSRYDDIHSRLDEAARLAEDFRMRAEQAENKLAESDNEAVIQALREEGEALARKQLTMEQTVRRTAERCRKVEEELDAETAARSKAEDRALSNAERVETLEGEVKKLKVQAEKGGAAAEKAEELQKKTRGGDREANRSTAAL